MSLRAGLWPEVPGQTAVVARASFPRGPVAMRVRDHLGAWCQDADFAGLYGDGPGRPGLSPAQLMVVTVLQFAEDMTDRQAADAVRGRIGWKYCPGLQITGSGFDFPVLSGSRDRLAAGDAGRLPLGLLPARLREAGLVLPDAAADRFHPCAGPDRGAEPAGAGRGGGPGRAGRTRPRRAGLAGRGHRRVLAAGLPAPDLRPAAAQGQGRPGQAGAAVRPGRLLAAGTGRRPGRAAPGRGPARAGGAAGHPGPAVLPVRRAPAGGR